jgi:hypothetical protein
MLRKNQRYLRDIGHTNCRCGCAHVKQLWKDYGTHQPTLLEVWCLGCGEVREDEKILRQPTTLRMKGLAGKEIKA